MTDHGEQAIGTLQVGETVSAYNPNTQQMDWEPILHVWVHSDNDLVDLTLTAATLPATSFQRHRARLDDTNEHLLAFWQHHHAFPLVCSVHEDQKRDETIYLGRWRSQSETQFFAYFMYKQVTFSEIDEMSMRDAYPKGEEYEDNYIEGNVCIILWKVVERSIAS